MRGVETGCGRELETWDHIGAAACQVKRKAKACEHDKVFFHSKTTWLCSAKRLNINTL